MRIRRLEWDVDAWEDYMYWHMQDKKTLKRINELIKDMLRHPFDGKGKPEPLKRNLQGFWSRRIDGANRIVYAVEDEKVIVILAAITMMIEHSRRRRIFCDFFVRAYRNSHH